MSTTTQPLPLKIAIIGTGLIGPRHAEAVVRDPNADLIGIVDPNPAAQAVAERFECAYYKSVNEMLASCQPDGALVCTPNHTHVAISKELLKGGVHVLCEKPISIDSASGQELVWSSSLYRYSSKYMQVDCAKASGRQLLIGHHRRFNRYVIATKNALPSLGRVITVNGLWTLYKPPEYFEPPMEWHKLDSAGPILINLIHDIDILQSWLGPIVRVFAEKTISQRDHPAEEGAAITLKFANGIVGTFVLSDAVVSPHNFESGTGENPTIPATGLDSYRIFGTEGSLSFPDMIKWTYGEKRSWTEQLTSDRVDVPDLKIPFELQVEHFVKVIRGEEVPNCSGSDGLRAVSVCEAIRRSIAECCPVVIPVET